jgi:hypothetical protein
MPKQDEYAKASRDSSSAKISENRKSFHPGAAVRLGHVQSEQALPTHLEPHFATELVVRDVLFLLWPQSPVDEGTAAFPERVVILVEDRPSHHALHEKIEVTRQ